MLRQTARQLSQVTNKFGHPRPHALYKPVSRACWLAASLAIAGANIVYGRKVRLVRSINDTERARHEGIVFSRDDSPGSDSMCIHRPHRAQATALTTHRTDASPTTLPVFPSTALFTLFHRNRHQTSIELMDEDDGKSDAGDELNCRGDSEQKKYFSFSENQSEK